MKHALGFCASRGSRRANFGGIKADVPYGQRGKANLGAVFVVVIVVKKFEGPEVIFEGALGVVCFQTTNLHEKCDSVVL